LFRNPYTFPWDFIGMERPLIGSVHSYLCEILAPYAHSYWQPFMRGRPSLGELRRRQGSFEMLVPILKYVDEVGNYGSVGQKVVDFLHCFEPFKQDLSKIVDRKFREGLIKVPDDFLTQEGRLWLRR